MLHELQKVKKNNNNVQNHPESILRFYGSKPITNISKTHIC